MSQTDSDSTTEKFRKVVVEMFTLGNDGELMAEEVRAMWLEFLGPDDDEDEEPDR